MRYSTVLGPGIRKGSNMSGPLENWVKAGRGEKAIRVFQDGEQTRDYVHVDDVVSANLVAVKKLKKGSQCTSYTLVIRQTESLRHWTVQ